MRDGKGFTLVEVLIALAIIGGLLVTLIYTVNYHLGIVSRQETVTVATLLAKSKMAELEKLPAETKGNFEEPYDEFIFETTVKESSYAGVNEISVIVTSGQEEVRMYEFVLR